jgi:hypothetical protein
MARASLDERFKEELTSIEHCMYTIPNVALFIYFANRSPCSFPGFKFLSESERTASLYSLLQHATPSQIKFFIAVLQQMAKADPMTAATPGGCKSPRISPPYSNLTISSSLTNPTKSTEIQIIWLIPTRSFILTGQRQCPR